MRMVFMGTPQFAVVSLKKLVRRGFDIAAVVTAPDKPKGRGLKVQYSAVKQYALSEKIPILQPETLDDESFLEELKARSADLFVVVAFRILPKEVFSIPLLGTINLHASLLPKYRGAAPINWAIIRGESRTGVSTILINEKVDSGDILLQREVPITPQMTAGELHDLLAESGADLLVETLQKMISQSIEPIPQNVLEITKAPKLKPAMCHIDFKQPAEQIYNFIRGLSPNPGAYCYHDTKQLKIFKAAESVQTEPSAKPGQVIAKNKDRFTVQCAEKSVDIFEVQLQNKKRLTVKDFFNGYSLNVGDMLV